MEIFFRIFRTEEEREREYKFCASIFFIEFFWNGIWKIRFLSVFELSRFDENDYLNNAICINSYRRNGTCLERELNKIWCTQKLLFFHV